MLIIKSNASGIDKPIQGLQQFLYKQLKALWKLDDTSIEGNGRCYREKVDTGYVPRLINADMSYRNVEFIDDVHACVFFFDLWDSVRHNNGSSLAKVDLIFMVNLSKIKPEIPYRADEETRMDVLRLCSTTRQSFVMKEFGSGIKYVLNRFDGLTAKDTEQYRDVQPLHVFKVTFDLLYHIK